MSVLLETRGLKKHYRMGSATVRALDGVSLVLAQGEFVALRGPSGSGKTLHRRRSVGIIFQSFNLVSTMTAHENVTLAMMFAGMPRVARNQSAAALLQSVGLGERQQHRPRELSGGEQQRVAIARALSNGPHLLLADEPTGNLDSRTSRDIIGLTRRDGRTIIMVTHDASLAAACAHRTVTLLDGAIVDERAESRA